MNRLHRLLWIPTLLVVGACSHDESPAPLAPQEERIPIALNVQSVNGMQNASRTMIDDLEDLKISCTPTDEEGEGKGIGIWADYDIDESGNTVTYNIFKNITLVHSASEGDNPHSNWNYRGDEAFWVPGGKYTFTAYYPQEETKDYIVSSSNATTFIIDYNTNSLQCDLMVASNEVNTLEQGWNQNDPVQLKFYHTMAAVKIQCKFVEGYDYEDKLTSCWLQNTEKKDFTTVGMMVYGDKENLDNIQWFENFQPSATQKIYYWKNSGVAFKDQIPAKAYTSEGTTQGNAFAQNDAVEEEEIEMLPPSLADDDDFLDENEDPLFTDEELASIVQKAEPASQEESDSQPASYTEPEPIIEDADPLTASAPSEPKQKKIDGIFDVLEMFVFALAFVLIAMAFCFRHSVVDGPSMMNTFETPLLIASVQQSILGSIPPEMIPFLMRAGASLTLIFEIRVEGSFTSSKIP